MVVPFVDSPQTERNDQTNLNETHFDVDFSMATFQSPAKRDDNLLSQIRGMGSAKGNRILATPRARQPLGERKNPPGNAEFTPLLKSAVTNRTKQMGGDISVNGIKTPAALRPGFNVDVTPLPEHSILSSSSRIADDGTPVPPIASSSIDLSTPLALPRRGEEGFGDGGNVLTLREQEAKLEQIDKENFGLKLKIHFLEENLKRTGPEANQIAMRENSELKSNKMLLERELKRYQKHLKTAESELQQYRQQLLDYAEKVKRRHMSEEMQEEMEELKERIEVQDAQIKEMQGNEEAFNRLRGEVDDAERELRERDEQLEKLEEKVQELTATSGKDQDEKAEEQAEQIEELHEQLRRLEQEKDAEIDQLEDRLAQQSEEHEAAIREMQGQIDAAEEARDHAEEVVPAARDEEIQALQEQLELAQQDKEDQLESLEDRLRLAEANNRQQAQLALEAAEDAKKELNLLMIDKDAQIASLETRLELAGNFENNVDETKKQLLHQFEEANNLRKKNGQQAEELQSMSTKLATSDKELATIRSTLEERDIALQELGSLRADLADRNRQLEACKRSLEERTVELDAVRGSHLEASTTSPHKLERLLKARDESLEALRDEMADMKQNLEDEIQVLETNLDDAETAKDALQRKIDDMEEEMRATYELRHHLEPLEKQLRTAEREKEALHQELKSLEREVEIADLERGSMQDRIKSLTRDGTHEAVAGQPLMSVKTLAEKLRSSQDLVDSLKLQLADKQDLLSDAEAKLALRASPNTSTKLRDEYNALKATLEVKSRELRSVERKSLEDMQDLESRYATDKRRADALLKSTTAELEATQSRLAEREARLDAINSETAALLKEKDRRLHELNTSKQHNKTAAQLQQQETETLQLELEGLKRTKKDVKRLRDELVDNERRHGAELKGLARQIQWLRAKGAREMGFREMLCFEKRWMTMQINMFGACNRENLRLLQEMGITPDVTIQERRPRLKTVGLAIVAAIRMRRWQREWAASQQLHESLIKKLESMRRGGQRRSIGIAK